MAFKVKRKVFRLQFEDPELADMSIRVRSISLGRLLDIADQADMLRAGAALGKTRELCEVFTDRIESWNLEDEELGTPIPTNIDGLYSLDVDLAISIMLAWFDAMTAIADSLGKASNSGQQSPEESVPTALL